LGSRGAELAFEFAIELEHIAEVLGAREVERAVLCRGDCG